MLLDSKITNSLLFIFIIFLRTNFVHLNFLGFFLMYTRYRFFSFTYVFPHTFILFYFIVLHYSMCSSKLTNMKPTQTQTGIIFSAVVAMVTRIALKTAASPPLPILGETCDAVFAALYQCEAAPPPERRAGPDTGCAFPGSSASPSKTRPSPPFPRRGQGHPQAER